MFCCFSAASVPLLTSCTTGLTTQTSCNSLPSYTILGPDSCTIWPGGRVCGISGAEVTGAEKKLYVCLYNVESFECIGVD